jgi:ATP-dependent DNA helicase RecQ
MGTLLSSQQGDIFIESRHHFLTPLLGRQFDRKLSAKKDASQSLKNMPICPKCGGQLILRTARRGRNAGNQFYGCSKWRRGGAGCNFTIDRDDWDEQHPDDLESEAIPLPITPVVTISPVVPLPLKARAKYRTHQVRFFQTMAVPRDTLRTIQDGSDVMRQKWLPYSTWRCDRPQGVTPHSHELEHTVLLVAMKILTRGRLTVTSPFLERAVSGAISQSTDEVHQQNSPPDYFALMRSPKEAPIWFDGESGAEETFYWSVLPNIVGPGFRQMTLPQVQFASLIRNDAVDTAVLSQRVDFLITIGDKRIVVELNGPEHDAHQAKDEERQRLLTAAGFDVLFIQNEEVHAAGPNIKRLFDLVGEYSSSDSPPLEPPNAILSCVKLAHVLQITAIEALQCGQIKPSSTVLIDGSSLSITPDQLEKIASAVVADLREMVHRLASLHGITYSLENFRLRVIRDQDASGDMVITFGDTLHPTLPTFLVQDIAFSGAVAFDEKPTQIPPIEQVSESDVAYFMQYLFGHGELREGQYEAVSRALVGKDAIVLLPTGHGKSAAFQLASMLLPGVTIVIDPIIALMDDQIDNLRRSGIDRAIGISSQIGDPNLRADIISAFGSGQYAFCYVAPERFQSIEFRNTLRTLTVSTPIAIIAIDEAHCVSEWGHDFRTSYLNIGRTAREYCRAQSGRIPPLLALTGTASHAVLNDVQRELQIEDFEAVITPATFNRKELHFAVFSSRSSEKTDVLRGILERWLPEKFGMDAEYFFEPRGTDTSSGLVFCPHVNGTHGVLEMSSRLNAILHRPIGMYSGAEPKRWNDATNWTEYKKSTAHGFKSNLFPVLVATKSFGMGIDKPNIRYTVHYGLPPSIESFYQEAGRAGRDRKLAECCIIVSNDVPERTQRLLAPQTTAAQLAEILRDERDWDSDDDITRAMFFHSRAFKGIEGELRDISRVMDLLGDVANAGTRNIIAQNINRQETEKAIHRLLVIGVVRDYTIDYAAGEFHVQLAGASKEQIVDTYTRYIEGYNKGRVASERTKLVDVLQQGFRTFVNSASRVLIEFIYDTIERGRRRALREMLSLAEDSMQGDGDQTVRERLLRYLETTYSREIEDILEETEHFQRLIQLVDGTEEATTGEMIGGIRSPKDAAELRGQAARYLESYPDHPGLLTLRAVSEIYYPDCSVSMIVDNLLAAFDLARARYKIDSHVIVDLGAWVLSKVHGRRGDDYCHIASHFFYSLNDIELARMMMKSSHFHNDMLLELETFLFGRVCARIDKELLTD